MISDLHLSILENTKRMQVWRCFNIVLNDMRSMRGYLCVTLSYLFNPQLSNNDIMYTCIDVAPGVRLLQTK